MKSHIGLLTVAGVVLCGIPMWGYAADPPRAGENTVVGEVLKIEGDFYTVKSTMGSEVRLQVSKETKLDCGAKTVSATSPGMKADAGKPEMGKSAETAPPATAGPAAGTGGWSKDPIPVWQGAGSTPSAGASPDAGMSAAKSAPETKPEMSAETKPGAGASSQPQIEAKKQEPKPAELGKRLDDVAAGGSPTPGADAGICTFKTGDKVEVQKTADDRATSIRIVKDQK